MWGSAIVAYFHYLSFMIAFGALVVENQTLKKELSLTDAWKIVIADAVYGLAATVTLTTGVLRVLYFGNGTQYYLSNPAFYTKVGLVILVSLLSLYPTFFFLTWIKGLRDKTPPSLELPQLQRLSWLIRGELIGFGMIPLFAAMMARGLPHF